MPDVNKSKSTVILTVVLLAQGGLYYSALGREQAPPNRPLEFFASDLQDWHMVQEGQVEKAVQDVLRADDTLTRVYASPAQPLPASLFVAYFRTQRTGQAPHSPKNCLPGSGWEPAAEGTVDIPVSVEPRTVRINRYIVARGDEKSFVLYWYQSRKRVVASEYSAKFWLVADSIRYRRSDTALVRIVVPVRGDQELAEKTAIAFVQALFPRLQAYLPA
jgi:EpsI family protein